MLQRLLPLFLTLCIPVLSAEPPSASRVDGQIIDLHCHIAGIGAGESGCFVSKSLRKNFKFHTYLKTFGSSLEEVEREGDKVIVDRLAERLAQSKRVGGAVVLALDGVIDAKGELDRGATELYVPNDYVAEQVSRHPKLLFGASVNPLRKDALERLEWAKAHGAVLVKWLPPIQRIDPSDPRFIPFYRKLVELDLPLLSHTGSENAFSQADDRLSEPELLRLPLSLGVKVIAAHVATVNDFKNQGTLDRLCALMKEYPNLHADISSLTQINKHHAALEVLARPELKGRLLYGSDYPLIVIPGLVSPWHFVMRMGFVTTWRIARIKNPWDRDVAFKEELGFRSSFEPRANQGHQ